MIDQCGKSIITLVMKEAVNGAVTGNILNLTTAEIISRCQSLNIGLLQFRNH